MNGEAILKTDWKIRPKDRVDERSVWGGAFCQQRVCSGNVSSQLAAKVRVPLVGDLVRPHVRARRIVTPRNNVRAISARYFGRGPAGNAGMDSRLRQRPPIEAAKLG